MKNIAFKIEDELHQGLKIGATLEGKTIAEVLKDLIKQWVRGKDPFVRQLQAMPITDEDISTETMQAIKEAQSEKSAGNWDELSKKLPLPKRK
ncbi:MAG: hypothetical protein HQM09_08910 [Candidatus Riflebacteria bacterium]|nr:hypothetical protein [Candidatus Riflebacteria bacterium]